MVTTQSSLHVDPVCFNGDRGQAFSRPACGVAGALSEQEQHLKTGQSLPPVSPKPPPAGMVMPNVFGLQSMLSFGRSASGRLDRSNSGRSRAQVSTLQSTLHLISQPVLLMMLMC